MSSSVPFRVQSAEDEAQGSPHISCVAMPFPDNCLPSPEIKVHRVGFKSDDLGRGLKEKPPHRILQVYQVLKTDPDEHPLTSEVFCCL